ncbi:MULTISPECIES: reverse transcriptase family protein [Rhodococcus]|uniref:RNA-directed DNA polymerase n=1 Tax=Rhodococcus jostii TaxID=132919 RepID=A0ABU4CFJ1_RHOJO|nr:MULTISPECIES: reverse transcriptase family protein [Rhodococcus]MDI9948963.1 reverse transcriptase family protein [Rhodococcus sp. IEGM 1305]MDI9978128.1 reverse transcriptase family protein [Rhodococcus sp. IEGM 1307]MDV6282092.1 reverse transcriptase family protein [Rhodococcus jostii]
MTTGRALRPEIARRLAEVATAGAWTRAGLMLRFEEAGAPDAGRIASRLHDLMPTPPVDGVDSVYRLLSDLPQIEQPDTVVEVSGSDWKFDVPRWSRTTGVAEAVGLTPAELDWFADPGGWLRTKATPLQHYRYRIRSDHRLLEAPKERLREVQRRILRSVLDRVPPHAAAHGFVRGRSVHTFAAPHAGHDVVVRIDLRAFFPSVSQTRVRAVFDALGYPTPVSRVLAGLCTTATPPGVLAQLPFDAASRLRGAHLPQGAPTSPALANLVAYRLDRRLTGLARTHRACYTRYADDLAFSGTELAVDRLIHAVGRIVADEGFSVHPAKTRIMRAHRRQHLAGLVVNTRPQAARADYDDLRALLFNCARYGPDSQNRDGRPHFREYVYGRIAWVGESNASRKRSLHALAARVDWADPRR